MDRAASSTAPFRSMIDRLGPFSAAIGGVVTLAVLAPFTPQILEAAGDIALRAPRFELIFQTPVMVQIHLFAAVSAFLVGAALMLGVKGNGLHRTLGWGWVALMATTAVSSLFITGINGNMWSFIHFLSGWVIIALPMAVAAARRHDVKAHRKAMMSMFLGGLVIAGAFTFIPGRLMWNVFFAA
jgi:uncharacterized membrane protein